MQNDGIKELRKNGMKKLASWCSDSGVKNLSVMNGASLRSK
jgi:hypothetical protein